LDRGTESKLTMKLELLEKKYQHHPRKKYFFPLANAYREHKKLNKCIETFRKGLSLYPCYWAAKVALGRALLEKGDLEEALRELEEAATHVPENLLMHELLASIYFKKGDLEKADHHANLVLFVNPFHGKCHGIKDEITKSRARERDLGEGNLIREGGENKAEISFEEDEGEIITATLAELYTAQGLPGKALKIYQKLIDLHPEQEDEWKRRIAALRANQESIISSEIFPPEQPKKRDTQKSILHQLEAWLEGIERYEKGQS
jgi:tetratricopeptide (TPR) repeat protein